MILTKMGNKTIAAIHFHETWCAHNFINGFSAINDTSALYVIPT